MRDDVRRGPLTSVDVDADVFVCVAERRTDRVVERRRIRKCVTDRRGDRRADQHGVPGSMPCHVSTTGEFEQSVRKYAINLILICLQQKPSL